MCYWTIMKLLKNRAPVKTVLLNEETQSGNPQLDDILEWIVGRKPFKWK